MRNVSRFLVVFWCLLLLALLAVDASALCPADCELYWSGPTTYTDNTAIEPADLPLTYIVEWDGVLLTPTTATSKPLPKPYGHGIAHTARVKAKTARGQESAFSPPFSWSSPVGIPKDASGIGVR